MNSKFIQSGKLQATIAAGKTLQATIASKGTLNATISKAKTDNETVYILRDEAGTEVVGVLASVETVLTATADDIRKGKIGVTEEGITEGTKVIPKNYTTYGGKLVFPDDDFYIQLANKELALADFSKLQVIICEYTGSIKESTAAEIIVIDNEVYNVKSSVKIADVTKDTENNRINLGITNTSEKDYVMHYITCREV